MNTRVKMWALKETPTGKLTHVYRTRAEARRRRIFENVVRVVVKEIRSK